MQHQPHGMMGNGIGVDIPVRYHVPEFPHSSATFNIILGSRILTSPKVLQGSLGDSTCPMHPAVNCAQYQPIGTSTGLTWFPIVLNYIK